MNSEFDSNEKMSAFLPLVLTTLTIIILIAFQLQGMVSARSQVHAMIAQGEPVVAQAQQAQAGLQKLATDLLEAAKTDKDAEAIIKEFGISMQGSAAAPVPAPAQ